MENSAGVDRFCDAQKYVREAGLAYGVSVYLDSEAGHISMSFYRVSSYTKLRYQLLTSHRLRSLVSQLLSRFRGGLEGCQGLGRRNGPLFLSTYLERTDVRLFPQIPLQDLDIDAAKSSTVYNTANADGNPSRAAISSFINQVMRDTSLDFGRKFLAKTQVSLFYRSPRVRHQLK